MREIGPCARRSTCNTGSNLGVARTGRRLCGVARVLPSMSEGNRNERNAVAVAVIATVVLAGFFAAPMIAPAAAAAAGGASASGAMGEGLQAYGNVTHFSFQGSTDHGVYYGNVTYGFVVNVTETNTSANVSEIFAQETIGIAFNLVYCESNCSHPAVRLTVNYTAWETRDAWANITTEANVTATVNGTTSVVPAIGLVNSSTLTRAGLAESAIATLPSSGNGSRVYSVDAAANYHASSSASFTPALGLFPAGGVSPGESWASTVAFLLTAEWSTQWSINATGPHGSVQLNGSAAHSVGPDSGVVTLTGTVRPQWAHFDNATNAAVQYEWSGGGLVFVAPFAVGAADIPGIWDANFGGSWQLDRSATGQVAIDLFELGPHPGRYLPIAAMSLSFGVGVSDPTGQTSTNESDLSANSVAAAPMSPAQASSTGACLRVGDCGSSAAATSSGGLGTAVLALIAAGIVAVVALVAVAALSRRGRAPPSVPSDE